MHTKYSILFFLLFVHALHAKDVTVNRALQVATQFSRQLEGVAMRSAPEKTMTLVHDENPYYYVFGVAGEKGFVIVSGDDRARPVLGYSAESTFTATATAPPNFTAWLQHYKDEMAYLADENPDLPVHPQWQRFSDGVPVMEPYSEKILYTALWNQDYPYNIQCPIKPDGWAVTGCVATSMAIVMKYHADRGFKSRGTGSHSYIDIDGLPYSVVFGDFDWANMPDRTEDFLTDTQREAVAKLMYHCAVSIESRFSADGTGSFNWNTSVALTSFFGFDSKLGYIEKSEYEDGEWKDFIRDEIDAERPVIYDGDNTSGGHSFLLIGYNDDDMYFFNWGWGGERNGWFSLSALTPGYGHSYTKNQGMITGVCRATANEQASILRFVKGGNPEAIPDGIVKTDMANSFLIHGGMFENRSYRTFKGAIGVALTDAAGKIMEIIGRIDDLLFERNYAWGGRRFIGDIYCTATVPYSASDRIRFVTSEDGGQSWQLITGAPGIAVEATVNNDAVTVSPVRVSAENGSITIESPYSETVRIYSLTGNLLFKAVKQEGACQFNVRLPAGIVIVRGESWARKTGFLTP